MDPKNQLRLDGVVFAADDSEVVEALKSITLHQLWAKAYLSPEDEVEVVAMLFCGKYVAMDSRSPA